MTDLAPATRQRCAEIAAAMRPEDFRYTDRRGLRYDFLRVWDPAGRYMTSSRSEQPLRRYSLIKIVAAR